MILIQPLTYLYAQHTGPADLSSHFQVLSIGSETMSTPLVLIYSEKLQNNAAF